MNSNTVTQVLVKIKHLEGEAILQMEEIVELNYLYERQLIVTTKYGERSFLVERSVYEDLYVKYKKYKEEMKSLILAQWNAMEMLAE